MAPRFTCGRFGGWESSVTDLIRGLTLGSPFTKDWVGFAIHVSVNCPASPDLEVTPGRMPPRSVDPRSENQFWDRFQSAVEGRLEKDSPGEKGK